MEGIEVRIKIICPVCGPTGWVRARVPSQTFLEVLREMLREVRISGLIEKTLNEYLEIEYGEEG